MLALVREKSHAAGACRGAQLRSMGTAAAMLLVVALGTVVTRSGTDPTTQLRTTSGDIAASSSTPQTTYDSLPPSSTITSVVPSTISTSAPAHVHRDHLASFELASRLDHQTAGHDVLHGRHAGLPQQCRSRLWAVPVGPAASSEPAAHGQGDLYPVDAEGR